MSLPASPDGLYHYLVSAAVVATGRPYRMVLDRPTPIATAVEVEDVEAYLTRTSGGERLVLMTISPLSAPASVSTP